MKVLVTGGAGFIGSHIVDALLERGHEVAVLDIVRPQPPTEWWPCDISKKFASVTIHSVVDAWHPDAICHQAAQPSLRKSIDDPMHDALINIVGTINVIEVARLHSAHVVFASTSAVYGPAGGFFTEDSPLMPNLPYGIAKAAAETYLRHSGLSHTILRYGNVYGPRQVPVGENQLVPHALAHIFDGAPFVINGDGVQSRDWVYVADIARANVRALEGKVQGTYNCGTGDDVTVNTVCGLLKELTDWPGTWQHGEAKAGEARYVVLDSSAARKALGWRAATLLHVGLKQTIAAWQQERVAV